MENIVWRDTTVSLDSEGNVPKYLVWRDINFSLYWSGEIRKLYLTRGSQCSTAVYGHILKMVTVVWSKSPSVWAGGETWFRTTTRDIVQPDLSSARSIPIKKWKFYVDFVACYMSFLFALCPSFKEHPKVSFVWVMWSFEKNNIKRYAYLR